MDINNPATNILSEGLTESQVINAIEKSGYPLQNVIAESLIKEFYINEEWSYIDRDTKELRTIDILAYKNLYKRDIDSRVRPILNLLIECKKSDLPYIFFLTKNKPWLKEFPLISGLAKNKIKITTDDDTSSYTHSIQSALELNEHIFSSVPAYSSTFSKCARKGKDLELSGADSYNSLILPLLKSLIHFQNSTIPPKTAYYFDCNLLLGIAVLDAPMFSVEVKKSGNEYKMLPWVRVLKHESYEDDNRTDRSKLFTIDVVHKDFFDEYIEKFVLPFADDFSNLVHKHDSVIADGKAFIPKLGGTWYNNVESRLQPHNASSSISRSSSIWRAIFSR